MSWPTTFGNLSSPVAASLLDGMFNQVAAGMEIPCSAIGTNLISLTPLANFPALTNYNELGGYRFRAATSSTGLVTAQYNGLSILPVYHADGVTQASTGDVVANFEYVLRFSQALNGGLGGFFLESPALPNAPATWFTPGGRMTIVAGSPVLTSSGVTGNICYSPFTHAFCPVFNGTSVQMVQFTSALSDPNGLTMSITGGNFSSGVVYDLYMTLVAGVPTLCAIAWTNTTTRAVSLAVWGGFLTNNSANTAQFTGGVSATLPVHQGTFLGSFVTTNNAGSPNIFWTVPGAGVGGVAGSLGICNYYNKVLFSFQFSDTSGNYTYTSSTVRQAHNSTGMQITYLQSDTERVNEFLYWSQQTGAAAGAIMTTGIGLDSTTSINAGNAIFEAAANGFTGVTYAHAPLATFGVHFVAALEASDGVNANIFNANGISFFRARIWL